jgi:hypothetical protein
LKSVLMLREEDHVALDDIVGPADRRPSTPLRVLRRGSSLGEKPRSVDGCWRSG